MFWEYDIVKGIIFIKDTQVDDDLVWLVMKD